MRRYGHLDEPGIEPDYRDADFPGYMDNLARAYPWYRSDPFHCQPPRSGDDVFADAYRSMQQGVQEIHNDVFESMLAECVPDSEEYVVIDIGSHLGRRVTLPFARKRPNVRVYMFDKLKPEDVDAGYNYRDSSDVGWEYFRTRVSPRDDVRSWVNELLDANGFGNVTYVHGELEWRNVGSNLDGISRVLASRRLVFTGYKNPKGLGNVTIAEATKHGAERLFLNNTALEKLPPDSPRWDMMRSFLEGDMSEAEIEAVIGRIWDPRHGSIPRNDVGKYDYREPGQRMFATALKQLFILSQVDFLQNNGMDASLWIDRLPKGYGGYNSQDHDISAVRI
ncbi:MAG: hypothetical protein DRO99_01530 [Candidatus Aenigmatarchaeota archaeon]|nr:MAG: hypothetical protein DRO99_01530 [Candidatus Aenigmarchaeota archaeon]